MPMRNRVNQIYENYWNYTAAFTDFNGTKFRNSLKTIVEYLDAHDLIHNVYMTSFKIICKTKFL